MSIIHNEKNIFHLFYLIMLIYRCNNYIIFIYLYNNDVSHLKSNINH